MTPFATVPAFMGVWLWIAIGTISVVALVAVVSPRRFALLATFGSSWIDTNRLLAILDKRIDIDHAVLPFSRVLGVAVLASMVLLGVVLSR